MHTTLLSDSRFAQAVLSAAKGEDVQVCAMALTLLRQLEEDNALLKSPVGPEGSAKRGHVFFCILPLLL